MYQCGAAVAYLHESNVAHRDIKADNYLVDGLTFKSRKFRVVLTDMSTCKELQEGVYFKDVLGTKRYWAPEFLERCYRHEVDNWALGVLMWCLMTVTFPFNTPQ